MVLRIFSVLVLFLPNIIESARILGVFPTASISHQVVFQPIWKELSLRGHQVVVITPDPLHDSSLTNLTEIDMNFLYDYFKGLMDDFSMEQTHWDFLKMLPDVMVKITEDILNHPRVADLLKDNETSFDLVIAEFLQPMVTAFAYKYRCPFIGVASLSVVTPVHEAIGNPSHPILHPDFLATFSEDMTFFEKIEAVIYATYSRIKYYNYDLPIMDKAMRKYFGNDMPYLGDLERNASLVFLNTNPILHGARAYSTGVFEIGRMHIKPKKPLPKDLKEFLDEAKEGVIYFSLGSNIKSIYIKEDKRKIIMETFSELPYKVLWKFEREEMPNKPSNVKICKWLPQQDLLGHPNIKVFISQAGLQSTEEAIANEVPMLAIPFMGDQHANAKKISKLGIGLNLGFSTLTKDDFKRSIVEVIENGKYKKNVKEINKLIVDQPMTGLERTVWWMEYVIRHKGAPYFRNRMVDVPWYEYFLLDVICALIFTVSFTMFIFYKLISLLIEKLITLKNSETFKTD